jgi:hypothetical protein
MAVSFFNVKAEYAKDKDLKEEDVQALMEWVSKQPHLPQINGEYPLSWSCRN